MHADVQAERLRADGITAMVALRSGTAEYAPLRNSLSDRNYRQGNEQDDVQGNTEEDDVQCNTEEDDLQGNTDKDDVQGKTKEDDAQDIDDKNYSPTALNAILPRMTRSTNTSSCSRFRPWHCKSCICCQNNQAQRCHGPKGEGQCHQQGGPRTV
jgi:hypothetical protein